MNLLIKLVTTYAEVINNLVSEKNLKQLVDKLVSHPEIQNTICISSLDAIVCVIEQLIV